MSGPRNAFESSTSTGVGYPESQDGQETIEGSPGESVTGDGAAVATQTVFGPPAGASKSSRSVERRSREQPGLAIGARLGDYVLERRLGVGGMGEVFAARHVGSNELLALKTLSSTSATRLYRFKREFRVLADVAHRNLVRLYELVVPDQIPGATNSDTSDSSPPEVSVSVSGSSGRFQQGLAFFTMELLDGEPFVDWVRDRAPAGSPVTPVLLERIEQGIRQLVEGVHHLHARDCIHRDIKPSNVLVTSDGRVVVLDFGLVSELSDPDKGITRDGQLLGTPSYMAPEQATGQRVGTAADYYAIGVMIYQALTGHLPFRGSMMQQLVEKQSGVTPDPRAVVDGVPDWLGDLCVRLLAREPEDRPTGQELLDHVRDSQAPSNGVAGGGETSQVFVGRRAELASLRAAMHELIERRKTVLVHLRGRSGNGKSTLARRFRAELREDQVVVLHGRCRERELIPYKGVDAVIDSLSAYLRNLPFEAREQLRPSDLDALVRVFPVLDEIWDTTQEQLLGLNEARALGWATLRKLLEHVAEARPIVMHIDDFQWADLDSVQLLSALLRPPQSPPIMLLISYRSETQDSDALRALLADEVLAGPDVRSIELEALTSADAQELAASLLGPDPRADADARRARASAIALRSRGSPLFIAQMALGGRELESTDADLDHVIVRRLSELDEAAQRLLEVVAVFAGPMPSALALELCPAASEAQLATLCEMGLFVRERESFEDQGGDRIEATHDRVREVVLARLSEAERTRLHREIGARLLADHGNDIAAAIESDGLFTLVNHLDAGMGEVETLDPQQRMQLVRLNYAAGKRALESTAWIAARRYLTVACQLIEPWLERARGGEGETELCVDVVFARAQAEIALENPEGDALIEQLLGWSLSMHDYCRVAHWYAWHLFPTTRWAESVEFGRKVLPRLGFRIPRRTSWIRAALSYLWGWRAIRKVGLERIHELPEITDERVQAGIDIIMITGAQARAFDLELHFALTGWHGRLLARHGFHDGAGVALTSLALSLAALGYTDRAQQLVELTRELPSHRSISVLAQAATQAIEVWALPIFNPAKLALASTEQAYARACAVAPKTQIGAIMVAVAFTQYLASVSLPNFLKFLQADATRHEGSMPALMDDLRTIMRRNVEVLMRGRTQTDHDLAADLPALTDYYKTIVVPIFQALLEVLLGEYERAWTLVTSLSRGQERQIGPIWLSPAHAMLGVICMSERWQAVSSAERRRMNGLTRRYRATCKRWAGRCADNYAPMLAIVEAEIAGRSGNHDAAITELERARSIATAGELTWLSALASERLAKLAQRRGHATVARAAWDDAREAYASWGATAVVRRIERDNPTR